MSSLRIKDAWVEKAADFLVDGIMCALHIALAFGIAWGFNTTFDRGLLIVLLLLVIDVRGDQMKKAGEK